MRHIIQKNIISRLARSFELSFTDLKPAHLDNNAFTYHLKSLVREKLVTKNNSNLYALTLEGMRIGTTIDLKSSELLQQARSVFFVVVKNVQTNTWLVRKRMAHPDYEMIGFIHGEPEYTKQLTQSASDRLNRKTGLSVALSVKGSGLFRRYNGENLESFVHYTVLYGETESSEITISDDTGINMWVELAEMNHPEYLENCRDIIDKIRANEYFFFDNA